MVLNIFLLLVFLLIFLSLYLNGRKGRKLFAEAAALEKYGDFEAACYKYAETAKEGTKRKTCLRKIRQISRERGPFDYKKMERKNRHKFDCDGCSFAYHSEILYFIKEALTSR